MCAHVKRGDWLVFGVVCCPGVEMRCSSFIKTADSIVGMRGGAETSCRLRKVIARIHSRRLLSHAKESVAVCGGMASVRCGRLDEQYVADCEKLQCIARECTNLVDTLRQEFAELS